MIWLISAASLAFILYNLAGLGLIRFMEVSKDGGPDSTVTGFWFIEIKKLFSVALLRFDQGSRENFHDHAFHSISWVLGPGQLKEEHLLGYIQRYARSIRPVLTFRWTFHRVFSYGTTWVFTVRGPWRDMWEEYNPETGQFIELANHRRVISITTT